jgi:hypothetical protein
MNVLSGFHIKLPKCEIFDPLFFFFGTFKAMLFIQGRVFLFYFMRFRSKVLNGSSSKLRICTPRVGDNIVFSHLSI